MLKRYISVFLAIFTIISIAAGEDQLKRICVPAGYEACIYAQGFSSPDGLAMSPDGILYVAEEIAGRISFIPGDGSVSTFVDSLVSPEGITFDINGNLYVVEDTENGRLLKFDSSGNMSVLACGLDAPEGVIIEASGDVLVTESNLQFSKNPLFFRTGVTRLTPEGSVDHIHITAFLSSYSGISLDNEGFVYVCNETSGIAADGSIIRMNPQTGIASVFCWGLKNCEGLCFSPGGEFPLYVVEEDLGSGNGRLSMVDSSGNSSVFATGFYSIEDVLVDDDGNIFISEDATGNIILIYQH